MGKSDQGHEDRSIKVRGIVGRDWKHRLKRIPAAKREAWLATSDAIAVLGAARCHKLRKAVAKERAKMAELVCSDAWLDSFEFDGETYPDPDREGPPHAVRMKLSRVPTRLGDGRASRRWTPPQAVQVEDFLDGMDERAAIFYTYPPSASAEAIWRVRMGLGRIEDRRGRMGRLRTRVYRKMADESA